jgi:hypothetical protein
MEATQGCSPAWRREWTTQTRNREPNDIMALNLVVLAPHMPPRTKGEPVMQSDKSFVSVAEITEGSVTVSKYRGMMREVTGTKSLELELLPSETQQALAGTP